MEWFKHLPGEDGYYWVKASLLGKEPLMVRIVGDSIWVIGSFGKNLDIRTLTLLEGADWCGPLKPPPIDQRYRTDETLQLRV
jgi:hypothetical protein